MSNQYKKVTVEMNASAIKSLGRASKALSQLAGAYVTVTNETCPRVRRASR